MVELVLRQRYDATDDSSASTAMQAVFGVGTATADSDGALSYQQQSIVDDGVSATRISSRGARLTITAPAAPDLLVLAVQEGEIEMHPSTDPARLSPGQLGCIPLGAPVDLGWTDTVLDAYAFPPAAVGRLLGARTTTPQLQVARLTTPASPITRLWQRTASTLVGEVLQDHDLYQSDIIREQAIDALLGIAMEAFGISEASENDPARSDDVRQRAEAYMQAHLADPISIPDVAQAIGVSVRGLQLAYSTNGQGTAISHLRQLRMNAARTALTAAPDTSLTVSSVARRLGYTNFGRFAAHYRVAFDESPVDTLRSAREPRSPAAGTA